MAFYDDNVEQTTSNEQVETQEEVQVEVIEDQPEESTEKVVKVNDKKSGKKGPSGIKAAVSELKKVTWPSFGKVVKSTVVVLSVTAVFLLVVLGIDQLLYLLYNLLTKNM